MIQRVLPPIPSDWASLLKDMTESDTYQRLLAFLKLEIEAGETILPSRKDTFKALELTSHGSVTVVLLGQDPYHTPGMAHGLCFSVPPEIRSLPPSLKNIYRELHNDLGCRIPNNGCLIPWAEQGILLLNTALTVRAHSPNSHRKCGWQHFTDRVLELLNSKSSRVVFVLWGGEAQKKRSLITNPLHVVIAAAHPSPLSAGKFFGSRCFSKVNHSLLDAGLPPIDWQIPDV
ncbi:MAG: Uracil-DNA glycosylase [Nitrospira sp.]|nr:uracil-DNA glycosylase [Nitrospira sp.]ULA58270.1 MAG: Uracil-DNA glycosylase [Nitrospira sp.]